ncbi:MAG: hypothetical protein GY737_22070, partial [Desulfobacteraceae bacterium]|nr:hypothetical protein [Desulfobacteraceae bacterium]
TSVQVIGCVDLVDNLRKTKFFQEIEETIEKNVEKCSGNEREAEQLGWEDRRFALGQFILDNTNALENHLFPEEREQD